MKITVLSPSFSQDASLVDALRSIAPDTRFNFDGIRYDGDALAEALQGYDAAVVGLEKITRSVLDRVPDLKLIAKYGVGLDNIDIATCKERDIAIGWTGGVNKRSVAELTLGFMLSLCRNITSSTIMMKQGAWQRNGGRQLSNCTVGIIGFGHIGKEVAALLAPFGCKILAHDILDISDDASRLNVTAVTREEILAEADIVSLHIPFTEQTAEYADETFFSMMRSDAFFINTSRGGVMNQDSLRLSLEQNRIAGAALDVFVEEPCYDTILLRHPALVCTPHIGGNAREAVRAMGMSAIDSIRKYMTL